MMVAILEFLQHVASPWAVALGSVIAICSLAKRYVSMRFETRAGIIEAETAQLAVKAEQERLTLIGMRDQARLDRLFEAQLAAVVHAAERLNAEREADCRRPPVPASQPAPAQLEEAA